MIYSKGISWIGDCRIPFKDEGDMVKIDVLVKQNNKEDSNWGLHKKHQMSLLKSEGRFTPNLLVCDDVLNDGIITETKPAILKNGQVNNIGLGLKPITCEKKGDKGSNSRYYDLDLWFNKMIYGL